MLCPYNPIKVPGTFYHHIFSIQTLADSFSRIMAYCHKAMINANPSTTTTSTRVVTAHILV